MKVSKPLSSSRQPLSLVIIFFFGSLHPLHVLRRYPSVVSSFVNDVILSKSPNPLHCLFTHPFLLEYISQMEMSIDYSDKKVMGMVIATNLGKKTTIGEAEKFPMKMNLPSGYAIVGMNGGKLPASISNIAPIIHKVAQDNSSLFG